LILLIVNHMVLVNLVYWVRWPKHPLLEKSERSKELLSLIYTDVCGLINICVIGGYTCFITFTDDHSRYNYLYLMKYKSASFESFKEFRMKWKINWKKYYDTSIWLRWWILELWISTLSKREWDSLTMDTS
jgi:hypothetical protein